MAAAEASWTEEVCWECSQPLRGARALACPRCDAPLCPTCALELFEQQNAPDVDPAHARGTDCYLPSR